MPDDWEILREEILLDAPYVHVIREVVRTPSCPQGREWTKSVRKPGVTMAPQLPNGDFVMIREERVPARRDFWQFPAGQIDDEITPKSIEAAAQRELREEAGCEVRGGLKYLGKFFTSPGFTNECTHQFLAKDVQWNPANIALDAGEYILESRAFSVKDLREMIVSGVIEDGSTLSLYARLVAGGWIS